MKRLLCVLGFCAGCAAGANAAETLAVSAPAPATATLSITIRIPEILSITFTCATPDPSGDGACNVPATAPIGTAVASFTVNGAPKPYTGTPVFTEATGSFKMMSGNSIVTAVTPLAAASYTATVSASQ